MTLYYSDLRGIDERQARYRARSKRRGSAFGVTLLAFAIMEVYGISLPEISEYENGKPFFPDVEDIHFSVSHSRGHILCAVSDSSVGVDIEQKRDLRPGFAEWVCSAEELSEFEFFELWTLRESFIKLTGSGDFRSLRFSRSGDCVISPSPRVLCRIYDDIPGCSTAVCAFDSRFPSSIVSVSPDLLLL